MPYRWAFGDLRTGGVIREADLTGGSWTTRFDASDTLRAGFPLGASREVPPSGGFGEGLYGLGPYGVGASGLRTAEWTEAWSASAEGKCWIGVAWVDETVGSEHWIAGGPVWTRDYEDINGGMLDMAGAGVESYYEHRLVIPVLENMALVSLDAVDLEGAQLGLIAKRLVQLAHAHTGGSLPIALPTDADLGGAGTAHVRNYPGYELKKLGEALRELTKVIDGPEIQFVPRRRTDDPRFLEWVMRIGTDATDMMLTQTGSPWVLDKTVPNGPVSKIKVSSDASRMAFRRFGTGQGQGQGRPVVPVKDMTLVDAGYPLLEAVTNSPTASTLETIGGNASGDLSRTNRPGQTITITCDATAFWRVAPAFRPGDMLSLIVANDPVLGTGEVKLRSVAASGGGDTVEIQCAERLAL